MNATYTGISRRTVYILIVEDNDDYQRLLDYSIRKNLPQVNVTFSRNVEEALAHLAATCKERLNEFPDLVLLDLHLPELWQGWLALTEMRTTYARLPVIVMSNAPHEELIDKAYDLGAHSFIAKPFSLNEWEQRLSSLGDYWLNTVRLTKGC